MLLELPLILAALVALLRDRADLVAENAALRQLLSALDHRGKRPRLRPLDRVFWAGLYRYWPRWRKALVIVKPSTVVAWHRKGFRLFWRWRSRARRRPGRPRIDPETAHYRDGLDQRRLGRTEDPRRAAQARLRVPSLYSERPPVASPARPCRRYHGLEMLIELPLILAALVRDRADLVAENITLRQQLSALDHRGKRPRLRPVDRALWAILYRCWPRWREALVIVKPSTVVAWHRKGFKLFWRWRSRSRRRPGRPRIDPEVQRLIVEMASTNIGWGAPRIHGELCKLRVPGHRDHLDRSIVITSIAHRDHLDRSS